MLEHYRRFIAFRRGHPAFAKGDIEFLAAEGAAVSFTRKHGNETLVCAFNLGAAPVSLALGLDRAEPLAGHGFDGAAAGGTIDLSGYQAWFGRLA